MLNFSKMIFVILSLSSKSMSPCDWLGNIRVWMPDASCKITEPINFYNSAISDVNTSIINILRLPDYIPGLCQFSAVSVSPSAKLMNGVFVVNATIDLSEAEDYCSGDIYVSIFAASIFNPGVRSIFYVRW